MNGSVRAAVTCVAYHPSCFVLIDPLAGRLHIIMAMKKQSRFLLNFFAFIFLAFLLLLNIRLLSQSSAPCGACGNALNDSTPSSSFDHLFDLPPSFFSPQHAAPELAAHQTELAEYYKGQPSWHQTLSHLIIPFNNAQWDKVKHNLDMWVKFPPCDSQRDNLSAHPFLRHIQTPTLIFYASFSSNTPPNELEQFKSQTLSYFDEQMPSHVAKCFSTVKFAALMLTDAQNSHVTGARLMFEHLLETKLNSSPSDQDHFDRLTRSQPQSIHVEATTPLNQEVMQKTALNDSMLNITHFKRSSLQRVNLQDQVTESATLPSNRSEPTPASAKITPAASYVLYMEPDMLPVKSRWLSLLIIECSWPNPLFWIKGSIFRGSANLVNPSSPNLPNLYHINGNAIYNLADDNFKHFYFNHVRPYVVGKFGDSRNAYDTDFLEFLWDTANYEVARRVFSRYQYSESIVNMWKTEYTLASLSDDHPNALLVHGGTLKS